MFASCLRARPPRGDRRILRPVRDPDLLAAHLVDAAHFPGGHAEALVSPETEAEVADVLRGSAAVLPIGAQSSLTGGATPMGEVLLDTARLNAIEWIGVDRVRVQAGVTLAALDEALERAGRYYPPAPTFAGAFVGGTVATNAAGAATFKYGTTRDWVEALTIVLPGGDALDIERRANKVHHNGYFDLELAGRSTRVQIPCYRMPPTSKLSAGYFAAPGMDPIDLFIGSEGTLGVVTAVTLRVLPVRPAVCLAFVPFAERGAAVRFVRRLREAATESWQGRRGLDISGIEHLDAQSLTLIRQDGLDHVNGVDLPADARMALLVTLELPPGMGAAQAFDEIGRANDPRAPDTSLVRFCAMLDKAGVLDRVAIAPPGDKARAQQLLAVREGVPAAVNQRIGAAKRTVDARIEKVAADIVVPLDRLEEMLDFCDAEFLRRSIDGIAWGHISDGNLHPNAIPHSPAELESAKSAILAIGREAIRLGGAPLAEHGVGRNRIKQELLRDLYGDQGIEEMRRVKRAIDPTGKLSPGVLFPAGRSRDDE